MPTNPAVRSAIASLAKSMVDISDDTLDALTSAACDALPHVDYAGVTIVESAGVVSCLAATDPLLSSAADLQKQLGSGPLFDPATEDGAVISESLADDERWPEFGAAAAELGLGAYMGIDLHHPGKARAALELYSRSSWVFVSGLEDAEIFASHASLVLGFAQATDHFQAALSGRKTIGLALGIVMERYDIDEDRAFSFMVRVSQDSNTKLREVAADIVAGVNRRNHP